jgi:hypothetical protein
MKNDSKLQHHTKGQKSLVQQKSSLQRFWGIPQRFQEMLLGLNLQENLWRFRGLGTQHHKTQCTSNQISKRFSSKYIWASS